jgi:FlaG/FlaF family flagellin (archaellin)
VAPVVLSPTSLTFATQAVATASAAKNVTLTNNLSSALTITSITFTGADPGDFAETDTCNGSVPAKKKCTISVTFTPQATGSRAATMNVNDSANTSPQTVSLTGSGEVQVALSPTSLTFAAQKVGTTSAAKTVTLTNNLATALTVSSITFTGTDPGDFAETDTCDGSVPAKKKCTISVKFTPSATGTRTATMDVNDSANNTPQTVSLTGTGK